MDMRFQKKVVADIEKCYATAGMIVQGQPQVIFAGEGNGALLVLSGPNFKNVEEIWRGGGGTMSVVPIDGYEGCFFASRGFYSMVESNNSTIEIVRYNDGQYSHEVVAELPYLHRFGIVNGINNDRYIVAATIADFKANKEDWSHPGHLYYAKLPENLEKEFQLEWSRLPGDYTINHGFCVADYKGKQAAYVACKEGIFVIVTPTENGGMWTVHQLTEFPASDLAVMDIDRDGQKEMAVISPFHGNRFTLYRLNNEKACRLYEYSVEQDFYHTVISAEIDGKRMFIGGARREAMQLFAIVWNDDKKKFDEIVFDQNVGPSNAAVLQVSDASIILSANRQIHEAALYVVSH